MEGDAGKPLHNTTEGFADATIAPHSATNVLTRSNRNAAHEQYTKSVDVRAETMSNTQKTVSELSKLGDANQFQTQRWNGLTWISGSLTVTGILSLISSVIYSSVILVWIGLGLTFWGVLLVFIRPQAYVRSDLMHSTALSSLKTVDRLLSDLGYHEKGVYIPARNPEKVVVFLPSEPLDRIPRPEEIGNRTFLENPKGMVMIPPGMALATLIAKGLEHFDRLSLEDLRERLPKLLTENLEMIQGFEMNIDGNDVHFRFVDSIYSDFCSQLRQGARTECSMGCPICSAMACILSMVTRKPVSFEKDEFSPDRRTLRSSYRILDWS